MMQRNLEQRLAIADEENLIRLLTTLEHTDTFERRCFCELPKRLTISEASYFLDISERDIEEKIALGEIKASHKKGDIQLYIKREELLRAANQRGEDFMCYENEL